MTEPSTPVALVTGGAQGIGRAIVARLHADGYAVAIADRDRAACAAAAADHPGDARILVRRVDVAREAAVRALVAAIRKRFGGLDLLVNNAGIADPGNGPLETLPLAQWNRMLAVNLTGAFLCAKHAIPALRARRGTIVNIASTRALQSEPHTEGYSATKGGLVALTHALAISLGPAVRVVCVSPGWIATAAWKDKLRRRDHAQHPVGRVGEPADIAAAVAWLASPEAGFITGQNLVIDGGMTQKMIYIE
jgi:NAD(P)-dependent dehydrogenase (short-subunit alcohol dehydrogenase family)